MIQTDKVRASAWRGATKFDQTMGSEIEHESPTVSKFSGARGGEAYERVRSSDVLGGVIVAPAAEDPALEG